MQPFSLSGHLYPDFQFETSNTFSFTNLSRNFSFQRLLPFSTFEYYSAPSFSFMPSFEVSQRVMGQFDSCASYSQDDITPGLSEIKVEGVKTEENSENTNSIYSDNTSAIVKSQIESLLMFFIDEVDDFRSYKIECQRMKYSYSPELLQLFDFLKDRYASSGKCREDMIRFILRMALKYMRDLIRDQRQITAKAACVELSKKYLALKTEGIKEEYDEQDNQEQSPSLALPYKKNSKYSTPTLEFIQQIFSNKLFESDYLDFLAQLSEILEHDNRKKINKFIDFLYDCVKEKKLEKIKTYLRLPWLKSWLKTTETIAKELPNIKSLKSNSRKQRKTRKASNCG